ncbi:T9SS C-terminal target domain-containing protein [Sphingobacteriales bacterium UPWRP_1]|nr:hypothetical protein B6N25_11690 [Sphingobacteriales bacterium TSM_CSS]PSJ72615.1 T9SS C-terminal target domain-containing protein [Sphingobacteriales bacterium UPWRP_1]
MKISIFFYILLFLTTSTQAQNIIYFNKAFKPDTMNILSPAVLVVEDGYLLANSFNSLNNYEALAVHKIDWEGNTVWFKIVEEGNTLTGIVGGGILEKTLDGNYIMVGVKDTIGLAGNLDIMMIKFNEYGDVIWKKTHGTSTTVEGIYHITPTQDGGYIMCGIQRSFTTSNRFYVLKTDAFGNKEWDNTYSSGVKGLAYSIEEVESGYLVSGYRVQPNTQMYLIKISKQGLLLWETTYGNSEENNTGCVIKMLDSQNYLVIGGVREFNVLKMFVGMGNTSQEGILNWSKVINISNWVDSRPILLNNGFVLSTISKSIYDYDSPMLIKFDLSGDTLWTRTMPGTILNNNTYLKDIAATADGGYILSGFNYSEQSSWVVKTDSLGYTCSYIGCDSTAVIDNVTTPSRYEHQMHIAPNPAQNQATVYLPAAAVAATDRQFLLYNASGQLVRQAALPYYVSQYTFLVAGLPAGIYFCRVGANMQKLVVTW